MSQTTMSIKTFKRVAVKLPPWTSVLLRANHGVGKSKVVRQVSTLVRAQLLARKVIKSKDAYPVIDRRLSQMTEGDMVGLPSTDGECTRFNPPDWYLKACKEPCALFLDELNRATPEVMQAAFQVVLDRELNGWKLHPESRVYSAINSSAIYTVNEMDPALLDRFFAIDLDPTLKDFLEWARNTDPEQGGNLHAFVPDFIEASKKHTGDSWLYPPKNAEAGGVHPSPRSWEMLNNALTYAEIIDNPEEELFYHMSLGFIGTEASIAFRDFCKSVDNRISGDEIVNKYHEPAVNKKVKRLGQGAQNAVVDKVSEYVIQNCTKLSDEQGANIRALMKDLPEEIRISLWSQLTKQGIDKIDLAKSIHKHCADQILNVFGVPMGEAGIGVVPNIPGIFKDAKVAAKK
jgi:dynein-related subfamily AAA family protein